MPCGWAVAAAIVRRAEMRAALDHLAGNFDIGLAAIVTLLFPAAARIFGDAARLRCIGFVLRRVPVRGPLPDIADHVANAVAVRRKGAHRRGALVAILIELLQREI